jgi:hypothetical protein
MQALVGLRRPLGSTATPQGSAQRNRKSEDSILARNDGILVTKEDVALTFNVLANDQRGLAGGTVTSINGLQVRAGSSVSVDGGDHCGQCR